MGHKEYKRKEETGRGMSIGWKNEMNTVEGRM
jgi:hypothetical protein